MPDQLPNLPVEAPDPFQGGEPTFDEFSKYRESGEVPERFKAKTEGEAAPAAKAETVDGQEPPKETEQEKTERERDEKGQFKAKDDKEPLFTADQQKAFDKAFAKREAKLRREFESRYAAQTSSTTQPTAAAKTPDTAADATGEPKRPEPPKLSKFEGTVEQYEKALEEYQVKLATFLDDQHQQKQRQESLQKKLVESEQKARKANPDYEQEMKSLWADVAANEEPHLSKLAVDIIAHETDDPFAFTYYLAKNRDEFRRFAGLSPEQTLREVLRLDVKLSLPQVTPAPAKKEPEPKPKPPEPVGARATSSAFDVYDEKLDADTWARLRNEQLAKRGRR